MATYVISPNGSDSNSGSVLSPKAITWLSNLIPGDAAQLRGGTYNAIAALNNLNGTSSNHITIEPYGSESPVFDGGWNNSIHPAVTPGTVSGFQYAAMIDLSDCSYIDVTGLTVQNFDGEGFNANRCETITFTDCVVDTIYGGSYRALGSGPSTADLTCHNISFINCRSTRACQAWKWFRTQQGDFYVNTIPSSILVGRGAEDILIQGMICEYGGAEGINAARGSRRVTIEDCRSSNNRHNNIYVECTQETVIRRNICYYTHAGVAEIPSMRGFNLVIRDEVGAYSQGYDVNYASRDNEISNNLFVDGDTGIEGYGKGNMVRFTIVNNHLINNNQNVLFRGTDPDRDTPTGNVFRNNIVLTTDNYTNNPLYGAGENFGNSVATSTGMTYSNNLWYDAVNAGDPRPANAVGTNDVTDDPLLVNSNASLESSLNTNNFELTSSSPAINAGVSVTGVTSDLLQRSYVGNPDIGCLEESGATEPFTCPDNMLTNADFSSGETGWTAVSNGTNEVSSGEYHISGTSGTSQLYQGDFVITSGKTYALEFVARSVSATDDLDVDVTQDNSPFTNLGLNETISIGTTTATYSTSFTASASEGDARLEFSFTGSGDFYIDNVCLYPIGGGGGSVTVRTEYASSPTNTTAVSMTDIDIAGTPPAALVFSNMATALRWGTGFIAGSSTNSISVRSRDNATTTTTGGKPSQTNLVELIAVNASSTTHEATGTLGTSGLTLNKSTAPTEAAEVIAMLFAGSDVDADTHIFDPSTTQDGTYTKTGLSFQPNLLFFLNVRRDFTTGTFRTQAHYNFGVATSTSNQFNYSWYDIHNVGTTDVRAQLSNDRVMESLSDAAYLELTAITSDGYTITTRGASVNVNEVAVLAVRIDNASIYLDTIQTATSTGSTSYSVGFEPQAAMLFSTQIQTLNSTTFDAEGGAFGVGVLDEDGNRALAVSSEDNVTTTNTDGQSQDAFVWLPDDTGAADIVGSGSLGATTVDVNYTNAAATATYGVLLAIENVTPVSNRAKIRHLRQGLNFGLRSGF